MYPELHIGGVTIATYTLAQLIGITLAGMLAFHRLGRLQLPQRPLLISVALIIIGGAIGGLIVPLIITALQRLLAPAVLADWGGSSVLGVLSGGALVALLCCRHYRVPVGRAFDLGGVPLPLGQAIGRLGCTAAGCCYGAVTGSALGVYMPTDDGDWAVRYPTQPLSAGLDLLIFMALLVVERYGDRRLRAAGQADPHRTWPFNGFLFLLFALLYCLKRLGMEFLRGDALPPLVGPLNLVQLLCLAVVVVSGVFIARNSTPGRKGAETQGDYP